MTITVWDKSEVAYLPTTWEGQCQHNGDVYFDQEMKFIDGSPQFFDIEKCLCGYVFSYLKADWRER